MSADSHRELADVRRRYIALAVLSSATAAAVADIPIASRPVTPCYLITDADADQCMVIKSQLQTRSKKKAAIVVPSDREIDSEAMRQLMQFERNEDEISLFEYDGMYGSYCYSSTASHPRIC